MNEKTKTNKKEVCACGDCAAANKKNKTWVCGCDNDLFESEDSSEFIEPEGSPEPERPDFEKLRGVKDGNKCVCGC